MAFVAVDLLRVDGQDLLGVPLLERKRLLEGVVRPSTLVRVSPFTRPPLSQWLATWKASGFSGAILKAANGPYEPGSVARDWAYVRPPRAGSAERSRHPGRSRGPRRCTSPSVALDHRQGGRPRLRHPHLGRLGLRARGVG